MMRLLDYEVGLDRPLFLIAGPCVIESADLVQESAGVLKEITDALGIPFIPGLLRQGEPLVPEQLPRTWNSGGPADSR